NSSVDVPSAGELLVYEKVVCSCSHSVAFLERVPRLEKKRRINHSAPMKSFRFRSMTFIRTAFNPARFLMKRRLRSSLKRFERMACFSRLLSVNWRKTIMKLLLVNAGGARLNYWNGKRYRR